MTVNKRLKQVIVVTVHSLTIPRGVSVHNARKSRDIQGAKLCRMHNFCASRSVLLITE